jgi:hypothetical protein
MINTTERQIAMLNNSPLHERLTQRSSASLEEMKKIAMISLERRNP